MKLKEFVPLLEGISPIVYHYTSISNVINIINSNQFKLSSSMAKAIERNMNGKYFYASFTRSRVGSYHYSHGSKKPLHNNTVMIKLNGQSLNHAVSGNAVDYWGPDFRKIDPTKHEMEDRIVSNRPSIDNIKKYIISVECYYDEAKSNQNHRDNIILNPLAKMIKVCINNNIPVNLYTTHQDFITGKRAISNDDALKMVEEEGPELEPRSWKSNGVPPLSPYIELMKATDESTLSDDAQKVLYNIRYYSYEVPGSLSADFHNANRSDLSRELTLLARNNKLHSIKDIVNFIKEKFK